MSEPEPATEVSRHIREAVAELGATLVQTCDQENEGTPRYLHATIALRGEDELFRLKVVNPVREDLADIQGCCGRANLSHGELLAARCVQSFRVPNLLPVARPRDRYVATEVSDATSVDLISSSARSDIAARLVQLEVETQCFEGIARQPGVHIPSCNASGYRENLRRSLDGLQVRGEIDDAAVSEALRAFDRKWQVGPLDGGRCFVHGDFSRGNVRAAGGDRWLIDFEHSHVGAPGLDLAHLYVNLVFRGDRDTAEDLRQTYLKERERHGLPGTPGAFDALVIERIAGKWNAMKCPSDDRRGRIRELLQGALA